VCGESAHDKETLSSGRPKRDHWAGGNQNNLTLGFIERCEFEPVHARRFAIGSRTKKALKRFISYDQANQMAPKT
jgi:hypothetical protein